MKTVDVVVIGAGILGVSSAYRLAKAGARVIVLEKGRIGWEASGRATGFHSLRGENPPEIALAAEANRLWNGLDEELGYPTEWVGGGRLWLALNDEDHQALQRTCRHWTDVGLPVRMVDSSEARKYAPGLSDQTIGGMYTDRGGHANPQRATQAFAWAFQDLGGEILEQTAALQIVVAGNKVTGVRTTDGDIACGHVIVCAGPQINVLTAPLGIVVPIATARLEGCITEPIPRRFEVAMVGHGLSFRQTQRGNIHFNGGPHEWVSTELTAEPPKPSTPVLRGAARRLAELFPSLGQIALLRTWAGIVEVTPDHATIIEKSPAIEGLVLTTGSGHGFGLSPAIGKVVSELVTQGRSSLAIQALGLDRFANLESNWAQSRRWTPGQYNT